MLFKTILKILKERYVAILLYVIVFFVMIIYIARVGKEDSIDKKNIVINVVNRAENSDFSKEFMNFLESKYKIINIEDDEFKIKESLLLNTDQNGSGLVIIEKNDTLTFIKNNVSGFSSVAEYSINEYLYNKEILKKYLPNDTEVYEEIFEGKIKYTQLEDENKVANGIEEYFKFVVYPLLSLIVIGVFTCLDKLKIKAIDERIRISPYSPKKYNIQVFEAMTVYVLIMCVFILGLAVIIFRNTGIIKVVNLYIVLILLLFCFSITGLSVMLSKIYIDEKAIGAISNVVALGLCFISGVFIPKQFLPSIILKISKAFPAYWYIQGIELLQNPILTSEAKNTIIKSSAILVAMGVIYLILSILIDKMKKKLSS